VTELTVSFVIFVRKIAFEEVVTSWPLQTQPSGAWGNESTPLLEAVVPVVKEKAQL
jgi:hypothetical protein